MKEQDLEAEVSKTEVKQQSIIQQYASGPEAQLQRELKEAREKNTQVCTRSSANLTLN